MSRKTAKCRYFSGASIALLGVAFSPPASANPLTCEEYGLAMDSYAEALSELLPHHESRQKNSMCWERIVVEVERYEQAVAEAVALGADAELPVLDYPRCARDLPALSLDEAIVQLRLAQAEEDAVLDDVKELVKQRERLRSQYGDGCE